MIISDLDHFQESEKISKVAGGFTGVLVGSNASAFGDFTFTATNSNTWAISSPATGSVALGYSQSVAIAYTPPKNWKFPSSR